MMFDPGSIRRPNALPPDQMTPAERRTELCGLLALGLVRLQQRERAETSDDIGERCRHISPGPFQHVAAKRREKS